MNARAAGERAAVPPGDIGRRVWAIGDGWIPPSSTGPQPEMRSHETLCLLNAGPAAARVELWFYFADREPHGPLVVDVAARRIRHLVVNDADLPEPIPHGVDYAVVIRSTEPIVVQHTRMDTRQEANSMMSTIAFGAED